MTEDDTFRILQRTSYNEMFKILVTELTKSYMYANINSDMVINSVLKEHYWTRGEWEKISDEYNERR